MGLLKIKKGLDIPIQGEPEQKVYEAANPKSVALLGSDYVGMKPTMVVSVGDRVKLGQCLFTDKKMPSVKYTSPGSGKVIAINRGEKRTFESIVIELEGDGEVSFEAFPEDKLDALDGEKVKSLLLESGLWTSLRERPFGKTANPAITPHSIFVNAMDTNPLAPSIPKILEGKEKDLRNGLIVLSKLTGFKIFFCKKAADSFPNIDFDFLSVEEFTGPHPAGLSGTHIHFLDPVHRAKQVWTISAQDTAAVGRFFRTGRIPVERIISIGGPTVKQPRLLKTRIGASIADITANEIKAVDGDNRLISGSVLDGRQATGHMAYLGRYHQQITSLLEGNKRRLFGWLTLGWNFHSVKKVMMSALAPKKKFAYTTSMEGGQRAIVPVGSYEKVMPLDILPTFLLRALMSGDLEELEKLGVLELVEEDLALCTYVCPAKINYAEVLRKNLTIIEKEG